MYISTNIVDRIKMQSKKSGIAIKKMLEDIGLGFNTMSNMKTSMPKADSLAKIADYLNCSVDYLLGRTDNPSIEAEIDLQRIINIYKNLNTEGRKQLLIQADILSRADEYKKSPDSQQDVG